MTYDPRIANEAAAVDQCMKLGAVILKPRPPAGFQPKPPQEPKP